MEIENSYIQLLSELKKKIRQAQQRAALSVNTEMLVLYWSIGNDISTKMKEAGWGAKIVNQISKDLKTEFPEMNGFSPRNLRYMRSFCEAYPDFLQADLAKSDETILQPAAAKLENADNQSNKFVQGELAQTKKTISPIVQGELAKLTWYHHKAGEVFKELYENDSK